jgi:peptide/nickel transport system permease protein
MARPAEGFEAFLQRSRKQAGRLGWYLIKNPVVLVSLMILGAEAVIVIFAGQLPIDPPLKTSLLERLQPPSSEHLLGTDSVGRDQLSRIIYGTRTSLQIAALTALGAITAGTIMGLVTGYFGGLVDLFAQRLIDTLQAFPAIIMGMLMISIFSPTKETILIPMIIIFTPNVARVVRASVLAVRARDFITASQTIGAAPARIMVRHILPNVVAPILVLVSLIFGYAILVEATLSFLGLGPQPPEPTLGGILSQEGRSRLAQQSYLTIYPAIVISVTVLAANIIGDSLRDALDPTLRGRR